MSRAENNLMGMLLVDMQGYIRDANIAAAIITGYSANELQDRHISELSPRNLKISNIPDMVQKLIEKEYISNHFTTYKRKDGSLVNIDVNSCAIKDRKGKLLGAFCVLRERSVRSHAVHMAMVMAALEEQHLLLMDNIPLHVGFVDKTDYYRIWNSYSEKMFGYTREEAIRRLRPLMLISSQQEADRITRIVSEKGIYDGEASMRHRSGSLIYAHLVVIPFKNKEGQIQGFYEFAEDITKQKANDEELQKRKNELEYLNNALRVILQKRDEEKKEREQHMFSAINQMIIPYVRQIKQQCKCTDPQILSCIDAIESNLKDFTIDFQVTLRSKAFNLSPTEIEVALFIKAGKTTKDIAQVLNISPETVESHRKNIRHKMGLQGKKKNLRSYLVVMDKM